MGPAARQQRLRLENQDSGAPRTWSTRKPGARRSEYRAHFRRSDFLGASPIRGKIRKNPYVRHKRRQIISCSSASETSRRPPSARAAPTPPPSPPPAGLSARSSPRRSNAGRVLPATALVPAGKSGPRRASPTPPPAQAAHPRSSWALRPTGAKRLSEMANDGERNPGGEFSLEVESPQSGGLRGGQLQFPALQQCLHHSGRIRLLGRVGCSHRSRPFRGGDVE